VFESCIATTRLVFHLFVSSDHIFLDCLSGIKRNKGGSPASLEDAVVERVAFLSQIQHLNPKSVHDTDLLNR
jgi:hypothetical protein